MKFEPGMRLMSFGDNNAHALLIGGFDGERWLCFAFWWHKSPDDTSFRRGASRSRLKLSEQELQRFYTVVDTDDPNEVTP